MGKIVYKNPTRGYSAERMILAGKCAEELGITQFNQLLYEVAVNKSDLPGEEENGIVTAMPEQSLLTMKLVYRHGGSLSVVDTAGHTLIMPDTELIRQELRSHGYTICAYGATYPDGEKSSLEVAHNLDEQIDREISMDRERDKCTLSDELAQKVIAAEGNIPIKRTENHSYDVFDRAISSNADYSNPAFAVRAVRALGVNSPQTRKFITAMGSYDTNEPAKVASSLIAQIIAYKNGAILNDSIYFGRDGIGESFKVYESVEEKENQHALD